MAAVDASGLPHTALNSSAAQDDPFEQSMTPKENRKSSHRFSAFDTQLFASYQPSASPATAKRALEAHLSETDKRLEEASKLGTALVQQRQDLAEKLKEVEQHLDGQELTPELRQQLADVEKEYNELGRESARAFLAHKPRNVSGEGETPARSASPTKFSSQATDSPSKMSVPSRKQRNQPTNRVGDIEFVTQISTSLLSQVRQLQSVLAERDESLKSMTLDRSRLELDNEALVTRVKALDENEQRYKDENWGLETQTHELMASAKDSATREQKLQQSLAQITAQKNAAQRELDDVRLAHGKVTDDLAAFKRTHDAETSGLRKNAIGFETERDSMQRKIEELTTQNQELAKVMAGRFRSGEEGPVPVLGPEPEEFFLDATDTDHSPPPSPTKGASRNSMLESETLKTSLHHAHRMIQNLKSNIHREKTEKLELKRLLQESRDELEQRRGDVNGSTKRVKTKPQPEQTKRMVRIGQLGAGRQSETNIENDPDWIDHGEDTVRPGITRTMTADTTTDAYQTANETDDGFVTADEAATETEAFQTGNEGGDSSDELTETEGTGGRAVQPRKVSQLPPPNTKRESFISTASDSENETPSAMRTPLSGSVRYRGQPARNDRKTRLASEEPQDSPATVRDSPASFVGAGNGQSLYAELEDLEGASDDDAVSTPAKSVGTPARGPSSSFLATPSKLSNSVRRTPSKSRMVDSSMMTEAWKPEHEERQGPLTALGAAATAVLAPILPITPKKNTTDTGYQPSREPTPAPQETRFQPSTPPVTTRDVGSQRTRENTPMPESVVSSNETPDVSPQKTESAKRKDALGFSAISSADIRPSTPPPAAAPGITDSERPSTAIQNTPLSEAKDVAKGGVIGSVLGWAIGKRSSTYGEPSLETPEKAPIEAVESASTPQATEKSLPAAATNSPAATTKTTPNISMSDSGAQTTLSSAQIDSLLLGRAARSPPPPPSIKTAAIANPETPTAARTEPSSPTPVRPSSSNGSALYSLTPKEMPFPPIKSPKRPGSAQSYRSSIQPGDAPPLPADHRQAIAAAQSTPVRDRAEGSMGPPIMTAAAYRAAPKRAGKEPEPLTPASATSATPRARYPNARSMRSRRSSVSSFESELDARFNIRAGDIPMGGFEGGTDPRMIQAITQTMIGEFLWKYTRKAGRGEMSAKRHRRFFWVHPYTRTLYWSDQDPSTAGRAQLKAKSVAIEAVRVVADDNPMPPGLHRKSLVIITPGRDIKFTATTGQRHETWFNALSYLLLRSSDAQMPDPHALTAEDVAEFNPSFGNRARGSRVSLSSYNSRTNTTRRSLASIRGQSPDKTSVRRVPIAPHSSNSIRNSHGANFSVGSRISNLWRPSRSSTLSAVGESSNPQEGSIYNASIVNDSAEDVRKVLEKQDEDADRLENVRACCDGKHDVGSLNRRSGVRGLHRH